VAYFARAEEFSRYVIFELHEFEFEQFYKHLKLRCPWVLEPSLAGRVDAL